MISKPVESSSIDATLLISVILCLGQTHSQDGRLLSYVIFERKTLFDVTVKTVKTGPNCQIRLDLENTSITRNCEFCNQ